MVEDIVADPLDAATAYLAGPAGNTDIRIRIHLRVRRPAHLRDVLTIEIYKQSCGSRFS